MRKSEIIRNTNETKIKLNINLDGSGKYNINTGISFFDHMLNLFVRHGFFDMDLVCNGDIDVDGHHTIEDVGICMGLAIKEALSDKSGIIRYGSVFSPMDESLSQIVIDISGRSYLHFNCEFTRETVGNFETEMVEEFFRAVAFNAGITLHINMQYGTNNHHMIESIFKGFGRALNIATSISDKIIGQLSTKGIL